MSNLDVLLLDDEPIVGKRLKPALAKVGCEVEVFQNPVEALKRIDEKDFDIVVTDISMAEVDGMQVLEQVVAKNNATKVIMITGFAMMSLAREAMEKGAFDFIAKPFKPDDLRAIIARAAEALGKPIAFEAGESA
ncbi:Protein with response regulator receiver domain [Desulfatibacillum aliphaticivorans]|uniref:Protein with response regulator receiver domain n=1 Tax=Desulfatibacillum aliphaticivorans TaxID=218208 RepID=B8F9N1_DESAL|nr:response regulator [Desulfatibacillum aliphaticivorans]ACL02977.1 Protein with response regulator receiver domain [Desulfatibacillum aliphaticivorans]